MNKKELLIMGGVLVLLVAALAVWMYQNRVTNGVSDRNEERDDSSVNGGVVGVCAQDRVQCANGDFVARTLPDCRFICPGVSATPIVVNNSGTLVLKIGETGKPSAKSNLEMNPINILEDSRCPIDVQCIQAGTVRVRATVLMGTTTSSADFKLGEAVKVGRETITLTDVSPVKDTRYPITYADYTFTFKVK